jgi:Omp85 superfamily domain
VLDGRAVGSFNIAFLALAARVAAADPVGEPPPTPPPAVPPDQVSGVITEDDNSSTLRDTGRVALFPVRLGTEIAVAPLRGAAWLVERYQLRDRLTRFFVSDDGSYGFFPTAFIETGLGLNVGVHMFHHNLFGHGEHLALAVGFGGEFKQRYDAAFVSGPLVADTRVGMRLSYRAFDRSNFFGIGNADQSTPVSAQTPLDEAVHTRFGQDSVHAELTTATPLVGPLSVDLLGAYSHRRFNTDAQLDGFQPILNVYDAMSLVGFQHGANNFYGELALALDSRSVANRYISQASPSSGWYGRVGAGFTQGMDGDPSHYIRYTADVRRYIDLFNGDRVLVVRAYLEGVTADVDAIPFTDLPRLGGSELLRGFDHDRFRDRVAALGSLEYDFPMQSWIGAYAFVDAGRVAHDLEALDANGLHVGWGGGLELHTHDAFLLRVQAAHSTDGTFLGLALEPTYDTRGKARRK